MRYPYVLGHLYVIEGYMGIENRYIDTIYDAIIY